MKEVLLADLLSGALSRESADPLQKQIYDIVRRGVLDHTLWRGSACRRRACWRRTWAFHASR